MPESASRSEQTFGNNRIIVILENIRTLQMPGGVSSARSKIGWAGWNEKRTCLLPEFLRPDVA
jgi:hypothetical protein